MWSILLVATFAQGGEVVRLPWFAEPRACSEMERTLPTDLLGPPRDRISRASDGDLFPEFLPPALRADGDPDGLSLRAVVGVRWMSGHTSVREGDVQGTPLHFHRDLGLTYESGIELAFVDDQPSWQFTMETEYLIGFGSQAVQDTFFYNGHTYPGPSRVRDHLQTLTVRPQLALKVLSFPEKNAWMGPVIGLEYPYYLLSLKTNLQPNSLEDWTHFLPYPVLGAAGKVALTDTVAGELRVTAGYVPNVAVPFTEGGRLHVSARPTVFVEAPVTFLLSASFDLSVIASYQYWSGVDHSPEDGNVLTFSAVGIFIGAQVRW